MPIDWDNALHMWGGTVDPNKTGGTVTDVLGNADGTFENGAGFVDDVSDGGSHAILAPNNNARARIFSHLHPDYATEWGLSGWIKQAANVSAIAMVSKLDADNWFGVDAQTGQYRAGNRIAGTTQSKFRTAAVVDQWFHIAAWSVGGARPEIVVNGQQATQSSAFLASPAPSNETWIASNATAQAISFDALILFRVSVESFWTELQAAGRGITPPVTQQFIPPFAIPSTSLNGNKVFR